LPIAELVDRVFRLEVGTGPRRWGDKTPAYLARVDDLLACFPSGQVVAIVRDPRDVWLSLESLDWFGSTTWEIGRYLARNGAFVRRWQAHYSEERFLVVRYEDLVLRTETALRGVCEFLGVAYTTAMPRFFERAERNVQPWELDVGLHTKLLRPPSREDVGRWRSEGRRRDHLEIEALTVELIDQFGYERRLADAMVPIVRAAARARHHFLAPRALVERLWTQGRRRARTFVGGRDRT
jgi:hypothetical protein